VALLFGGAKEEFMKALAARWVGAAGVSSVAYKALAALTGLLSAGWCALHVLGNAAAFSGPAALDGYAAWLRRAAAVPLWGMRLSLLSLFGAHVSVGLVLWCRARASRPTPYRITSARAMSFASRLVRASGLVLLSFIVYHVLHVNYGWLHPHFVRGHVYDNLRYAFMSPLVVAVYLLGSLLVALHLAHGFAAAVSSLGWLPPSTATRRMAVVFAAVIGVGFAATPLSMALGVLR
jgi:succinate dehydrogenase / fumarate reductase cytochrome b subunit